MEERLSNLEKFQVLLLAKHSVATYEEVFEIGGELDDHLYRAWREMKRATLEERISVVGSILGKHLVSGVPKKRCGTRQPVGGDRVDALGLGWKDLFDKRITKKREQEERAEDAKIRKEEAAKKKEEEKLVKEAKVTERKRLQEERKEEVARKKAEMNQMKIDKENDKVEKQKREIELKEAKLREVTEAKQIQVGSKMNGGKIRPIFKPIFTSSRKPLI